VKTVILICGCVYHTFEECPQQLGFKLMNDGPNSVDIDWVVLREERLRRLVYGGLPAGQPSKPV